MFVQRALVVHVHREARVHADVGLEEPAAQLSLLENFRVLWEVTEQCKQKRSTSFARQQQSLFLRANQMHMARHP